MDNKKEGTKFKLTKKKIFLLIFLAIVFILAFDYLYGYFAKQIHMAKIEEEEEYAIEIQKVLNESSDIVKDWLSSTEDDDFKNPPEIVLKLQASILDFDEILEECESIKPPENLNEMHPYLTHIINKDKLIVETYVKGMAFDSMDMLEKTVEMSKERSELTDELWENFIELSVVYEISDRTRSE